MEKRDCSAAQRRSRRRKRRRKRGRALFFLSHKQEPRRSELLPMADGLVGAAGRPVHPLALLVELMHTARTLWCCGRAVCTKARAGIAHRSRGSAPCPDHSLRDTRSELVHVQKPLSD
ncbi:unnamed protein product [Pleuronectes platessa]|uniref:Uncharacterized protein n=1 Tax=Pleuronectes platessa TaxID=8262 RepID=A0A9N7Y7E2_PLEPL|nr:unnamed protein product [Pleuronectes platessa]